MSIASGRRELAVAAGLCAVGAALVLLAAGNPWVRAVVDLPPPLPSARYALTGRELDLGPTGLGLAGLAGLAGLVATRRVARTVVGLLLILIGAAIALFSLAAIRADHVLGELGARTSFAGEGWDAATTPTQWWIPSVLGGVLLLAAGVLTAARGPRWPGMSGRYDRPGILRTSARPPKGESQGESQGEASAMWDSLDRGTDPTVDPTVDATVDTADPEVGRNSNTGKGT